MTNTETKTAIKHWITKHHTLSFSDLKEQYPGFTMILRGSKTHLQCRSYITKQKWFYFGKHQTTNDNNPLGSEDG